MAYNKNKIFLLALHRLGITTQLDFNKPNDVKYAVLDDEYDNAIESLLGECDWSFARVSRVLSLKNAENGNYYFDIPKDCIRPLKVLSVSSGQMLDWDIFNNSIVSSEKNIELFYTKNIKDENSFSADFVKTLSYALASAVALSLTESEKKFRLMNAIYSDEIQKNRVTAANESYSSVNYSEYYEDR